MRRVALATTCIGFLYASDAAADEARPSANGSEPAAIAQAKTYYAAGTDAYSKGRYDAAVTAFEVAFSLAHRPTVAFALAQAERKLFFEKSDPAVGRQAIAHYKQYLEQVASGERRPEAVDAKADLEGRLGNAAVTAEAVGVSERTKARLMVNSGAPGARVQVDDGPLSELPFIGDIGPGKHRVFVTAEGYESAERDVSGDRAIDIPIDMPLQERPALVTVEMRSQGDFYVDGKLTATLPRQGAISVTPGRHSIGVTSPGRRPFGKDATFERAKSYRFTPDMQVSGQRILAWTFLGTGAASILLAGVSATVALTQESSARDLRALVSKGNYVPGSDPNKSNVPIADYNKAVAARNTWRAVAISSGATGFGLLVIGAGLYVLERPDAPSAWDREPEISPKKIAPTIELGVAPWLSPSLAGASAVGRF